MTDIDREINDAKEKFDFKKNNDDIVEISRDNVLLAEAIYQIRFEKYLDDVNFEKKEDIPKDNSKDKWSAKKCFMAMKNDFYKGDFKKLFSLACIAVNAENSTHLRKYEREKIVHTITEKYKSLNEFEEALKDKRYPIIKIIRELKGTKIKASGDKENEIRDNYSFATKLCHYACLYLFKNDNEYQDYYSIYDSVLVKALKKMGYSFNYQNYDEYQNKINEIICTAGITRNGFDHLMWIKYS